MVGEGVFDQVRLGVGWNGAGVDLSDIEGQVENGAGYGRVLVDLTGRAPAYRTNFHLDSVDFQGGKIDADGVIHAAGTGADLLAGVHSEGSFTGRALGICKTASRCYRLGGPPAPVSELQVNVEPRRFHS